jgi:hypothetical protein
MNTSSITQADLDTFVEAYISCALWSESIGEDFARQWSEQTGEDFAADVSLESFGLTADDITAESLSSITTDCRDFLEGCGTYLDAYLEHKRVSAAGRAGPSCAKRPAHRALAARALPSARKSTWTTSFAMIAANSRSVSAKRRRLMPGRSRRGRGA